MDVPSFRGRRPRSPVKEGRARVLQVYLDEPGGGSANVALLRKALGPQVEWRELCLGVQITRGGSLLGRPLRDKIRGVVTEEDPDIVHAHGTRVALVVGLADVAPARVVTLHGIHAVRRANRIQRPFARWFERFVLSRMDLVLCTGRSDARLVEEIGLGPGTEIRWIHSAFTPPPERDRREARAGFDLPPSGKVVLWMGRFEAEKRPLLFIEALDLIGRTPGLSILMAGDGSLYEEAKELVRRKGLADIVRMPGWCTDTASVYRAADILVSTSRWEGFPLTGLEAASAGLSLVLSDVPGNVDLVEVGLEAILIPSARARGIADGLAKALEAEPPDIVRTGEALANFSPQVQAEEVMRAYRDVLDRR